MEDLASFMNIKTNLILLEGVPGSGKSFTSQLLSLHLQHHQYQARWVYENEEPHPIYCRNELQTSIERALAQLCMQNNPVDLNAYQAMSMDVHKKALLNWKRLVKSIVATEQIVLLDSAFLQTCLSHMLSLNLDRKMMLAHILQVEKIIAALNPTLIFFYQDDVVQSMQNNFERRGPEFRDYSLDLITNTPFGINHGDNGNALMEDFLRRFQSDMRIVYERLSLKKLAINNSEGEWASYNQKISDFLSIPALVETCNPLNDLLDFVGVYRANTSDDIFELILDGNKLSLKSPTKLRLFHQVDNAFVVEGTLNELKFECNRAGVISKFFYQEPQAGFNELEFLKI